MCRRMGPWLMLVLALGATACPESGQRRPDGVGSIYDVELPRVGGGTFSLQACRGKIMMLDFFTTWSQASLVAIPSYMVLHRKYADQGLCMVGVALDELGMQVVEPFVRGLQVDYPVLVADEVVRDGKSPFGDLSAVPSLLIIDERGHLFKVFLGLVHPERIERVLKNLLP